MYRARGDEPRYHEHLAALVAADAEAGAERTDRTRYLAAQAGLVLAEPGYAAFNAVRLVQPLEQNLARKRELMDASLQEFERLISYEVGDVTTAATFYMAEIYSSFSRALLDSERPTGLRRRARRVRGRDRGGSVPIRGARDRGPRSERRAS